MTNLDYEQRMSALNQLIHETLGVSLNTVRAAYGRARNTPINICSVASATGNAQVSERRVSGTRGLTTSDVGPVSRLERITASKGSIRQGDRAWMQFDVYDRMPRATRRSFSRRFARAGQMVRDAEDLPGEDGLPMLLVSQPGEEIDAGESFSDWHKLRNEFWNIAQTNRVVMERYRRDVLG